MANLTADQHLERSSECLAEADALLSSRHPKGACNRAYYAVFNAAKAALASLGAPTGKTHSGTQTAFYANVVRTGRIAPDIAAKLGKIEQTRKLADYTGDPVDLEVAEQTLREARDLHAAVRAEFFPSKLS